MTNQHYLNTLRAWLSTAKQWVEWEEQRAGGAAGEPPVQNPGPPPSRPS